MRKKSPKPQQPSPPEQEKPVTPAKPVDPKKPMPPDAVKRAIIFYRDNRDIEKAIWRSIHG